MRLRQAQGQAWRTMAWGVAWFLTLQLGAMRLIESRHPHVRFPEVEHCVADAVARPPAVVALGSSRFGTLLDPDAVNVALGGSPAGVPVQNAAVMGGDYLASEHLLTRLFDAGARPALVVLETLPEALDQRNPWMQFYVPRQATWANTLALAPELVRVQAVQHWATAMLTPLVKFRREIRAALVGHTERTPWRPLREGYAHVDFGDPARLRVDLRKFAAQYRTGGISQAALERILTRCQALNVRVLLLAPPVASTHRAGYTPHVERQFQAALADLRTRHEFEFHDCRARLDDRGFADHHHAAAAGAQGFTRLLSELLPPVLAGKADTLRR